MHRAMLAMIGCGLAVIGEPEAALPIEHEIVRTLERFSVALAIERAKRAGFQIEPLWIEPPT